MIANIIRDEEFDVVALQEILSEGKALGAENYAKKSLLMYLGPNWDFAWADAETSLADSRNEGYAFVWNKNKLRLATAKMPDGSVRTFKPQICKMGEDKLSRKPFYARFTPSGTISRGPYVELRLLCIHAYYGSSSNIADFNIRQKEIETILKEIYPQVSQKSYQGGMRSYTIVLGDYNMELKREDRILKRKSMGVSNPPPFIKMDEGDIMYAPAWGEFKIITVQDELTSIKRLSENPDDEEMALERGYASNYDHFSYDLHSVFKDVKAEVERVDAVFKYCDDDFEKYHATISDHVPISMTVDLRNER
jgi:endonuclease/exonuclease/phosphatase family metal-dependent hydrolase